MQTPFHPPPHLQRGEKRKNMENTKAFPKELYQNVLKINNITQKKIVRRKRLDLTSI